MAAPVDASLLNPIELFLAADWVVKAGERTVSSADFKRAFDNYRKQLEQQNQGQPVTTEQMSAFGSHGPALQVAMFTAGEVVPIEVIEEVAERARTSFAQHRD